MWPKKDATIDEEGEKELRELEKKEKQRTGKAEKEYKKKHDALMKKYGKDPGSRLKFWTRSKTENVNDPKFWVLVNTSALKEFIKYGSNKVLDQIRVRTHANIQSREEINKIKDQQKTGMDAKQVAYSMLLISLVAVIAFVVVTNFLDYNKIQQKNNDLKSKNGDLQGKLAACKSELNEYNPQPEPQDKDNTLEG